MPVTIRLYAKLRDMAGAPVLTRDVAPGASVEALWAALVSEFPQMAPYRASVSVAVNADYSRFSQALSDGDEVVFLPPVSGG